MDGNKGSVSLTDDFRFSAQLSGVQCSCLLDTGSTISVLHKSVFDTLPQVKLFPTSTKAKTIVQEDLPILGRVNVPFEVAGQKHVISLYVSESVDVPCLLGLDFLHAVPCVIDLPRKKLDLTPRESVRSVSVDVTSVGKVKLSRDLSVAPGAEIMVPGYAHTCTYRGSALVEPTLDIPGVEVVRCLVNVSESAIPVVIRNVTSDHVTIPKHTDVADLEVSFVEAQLSDPIGDAQSSTPANAVKLEDLVDLSDTDLTDSQRDALFTVLRKHDRMFDGHIGHTDLITHRIDTGDHPPVRQSPRRIPPHLRDELRSQLDDLAQQGILEEADGTWASPVMLTRKKNSKWRLVVDLRRVNAITNLPAYPIPRIDDASETLAGSSYFCVLDMNSAYHQISIDPTDRVKTTITTPFGNWQYRRMCFGLASAPFTCAKLLNIVLGDMSPHTCVTYFDDIIVHGKSVEDVLTGLDAVLSRLSSAGLTLSLSKCQFFKEQTTFLGQVVSKGSISADPVKVQKVRDWPEPRTAKELSSFLGLCTYFKKYVKDFARIAAPLFHLTSRDVRFEWTSVHAAAFESLKVALTTAPVMALPRFGPDAGVFTLDCDASNESMGCVLLQEQDGVERVIAYGSKRLSKSQRNYSTTKKELLACVVFVQQFAHYLMGKKFHIRSDHSSLQWLLNFRNPSGMLARWLEILGNFQFDILYRPGAQHTAADAMSRRPDESCDVGCQTDPIPQTESGDRCRRVAAEDWSLSYIQSEQDEDETLAEVTRLLSAGRRPRRSEVSAALKPWVRQWPRLRLLKGVLFRVYKRKPGASERLQVVIPAHLVPGVLTSMHSGPSGGHFSQDKLLAQLQLRYYWPTMSQDVAEFCRVCDRCSERNPPIPQPRASMGELRATEPWEMVSIDFMTDLPTTQNGNKHILVCCDHFTRWIEVFPLPDMKASTVASVLVNEVFSRYSCPKYLHSDRAANFRGELVSEVCRLMGIEKTFTTSFHPQGNGRCERVNRTMLAMLSKYLDESHTEWDRHLPLLVLAYRAQVHRSIGYSPFFMMFGREPRLPVDAEIDAPSSAKSRTVSAYVDELCAGMRDVYREAIRISDSANLRNKKLYDRKLNSFTYQEGDRVMLCRNVAARGKYYKFVRPWKPAVIVSKIGELNYRVRLEGGQMLSVHHNRLKPYPHPEQDPVIVPNRDRLTDSTGQVHRKAARSGDFQTEVNVGARDGRGGDDAPHGEGSAADGVDDGADLILAITPERPTPCAAPRTPRAPVPRPRTLLPLTPVPSPVPPAPPVPPTPVEPIPAPRVSPSPAELPPAQQTPTVLPRRSGRESRPPDRFGY